MKKYAVYVTVSNVAYVEVEAEDEDQAEEKGYEAVENGGGSQFGDESYEIEVEEL